MTKSNSAFARNTTLVQSRTSANSAPGVMVMDRAGRIHVRPWSRWADIVNLRSWYARIAWRAQRWWRG